MKILKWLLTGVLVLVLLLGIGVVALVYLVDWNDFKETIENQVEARTGRELTITGDLSPSVFPWAGISIGEISLANADGFGDEPFARIGSADVKVEVLPLLRRAVNVRTVELSGLDLDLQRAADGSTNWDDLMATQATTTTTNKDTTTEVEGNNATIAALEVGGIEISNANVSWRDAQTGTDARLKDFNLQTGAIALQEPFELSTNFDIASDSMALEAAVQGRGDVTIDLENQVYSLENFSVTTNARGEAIPGGAAKLSLGADIQAMLDEQRVTVEALAINALGVSLEGDINVTELNTGPNIAGKLASNEFEPRALFDKLAIDPPVTADAEVLKRARTTLAFTASPSAAKVDELTIELDDTTLTGSAEVPSFDAAVPPLKFALNVDAIDVDRYLPPPAEGEAGAEETTDADAGADEAAADAPIELPTEMLRELDVNGDISVGELTVSKLTISDVVVPVRAANGVLGVDGMAAALYEGGIDASAGLDVTGNTPSYAARAALAGIQAEPLLGDLLDGKAFLSGKGDFSLDVTTSGDTVKGLTAGLNGGLAAEFADGAVNGINLGYQLRRAKAALTGQSLAEEERELKTDFSSLTVTGTFIDGVLNSDDLDLRSPLLRVAGAGQVDLPGENVDYTLVTKVTGTTQGQGGADLASLKGVDLQIPIRGSFQELSDDFAGVMWRGLKDNLAGNVKDQAKALADQEKARLEAKAREQLEGREEEVKQRIDEAADKARDELKGKLNNLLK